MPFIKGLRCAIAIITHKFKGAIRDHFRGVGLRHMGYSADELYSTSITLAEILYCIELLPAGKRKANLLAGSERLFRVVLGGRILPFDGSAAQAFSRVAAARRAAGRPISALDAQVAAIASVHGATLATRNAAHFEGCGIRLMNPWVD